MHSFWQRFLGSLHGRKNKQLIIDIRKAIPLKPVNLEKYGYEYKRKGTRNIFVAVKPWQLDER